MPFDQVGYQPDTVVQDEVLRCLIALREFHADPALWCNTGMRSGAARCIIAGANHVAREMNIAVHNSAPEGVFNTLLAACPCGVVTFNEGNGTTHAELLAMYDRAISARRAELVKP